MIYKGEWRRRRDSNPRDPFGPAPLAGVCLRPLGHVSADPYMDVAKGGQGAFWPLFADRRAAPSKGSTAPGRGTRQFVLLELGLEPGRH